MYFKPVDQLPPKSGYRPMKPMFLIMEEFIASGVRYAQIVLEDGDYSRPDNARNSITSVCKYYGYPLKVVTRAGELYLVRTDLA